MKKMTPNQILLLFVLPLFLFTCQGGSTDEKAQRTIDPSQIKIDVEAGGVLTKDRVLLQYKKAGSGPKALIVPNAVYLAEDFKWLEDEYMIIYYDMRNRGRSQAVSDPEKLKQGIWNDVQDLEAVRQHFKLGQIHVVGHSYLGVVAALYAQRYPEFTGSLIMVSPLPPVAGKNYNEPSPLQDSVYLDVQRTLTRLEQEKDALVGEAYCRDWWTAMKKLYLADPGKINSVRTDICLYPNEHPDHLLPYLNQYIFPSLEKLNLSTEKLAKVDLPVLILHGQQDRVTPPGGAREWAELFPNATLVEIPEAGHLPWVENESLVFQSIREFLRE